MKKTSPNKGGPKIVEFMLATGTFETEAMTRFRECLDEGAEDRRKEDEDVWGWKRRKRGHAVLWHLGGQSGAKDAETAALRHELRQALHDARLGRRCSRNDFFFRPKQRRTQAAL